MWEDNAAANLKFHLHGAQVLCRLRGLNQRKRPLGFAMFEFIRAFMISHSPRGPYSTYYNDDHAGNSRNPQLAYSPDYEVDDIRWWASEDPNDEINSALQRIAIEATLVRGQMIRFSKRPYDSSKGSTALKIYRKAKAVGKQLDDWLMSSEEAWGQPADRDSAGLGDEVHLGPFFGKQYSFPGTRTAARMLNAHVHRLILAEILVQITDWMQNCSMPGVDCKLGREEAVSVARDQIMEVIAVTSYLLDWPCPASPSPYGALACAFQLYVTGSSPLAAAEQRQFIIRRLFASSQRSGSKLAAKFAQALASIDADLPTVNK